MDEKHEPITVEYRPTDTTSEIQPTQSNEPGIDVVVVSHKRPYGTVNFIGTYFAVGLGACSVYGAFVLPATSLSYINAAIGMSIHLVDEPKLTVMIRSLRERHMGRPSMDALSSCRLHSGRPSVRYFRS